MRFFSTVELVNALEQEKALGKPGQMAYRLMYKGIYEVHSVDITTNLNFTERRCQNDHRLADSLTHH